jgi:outer membrane receptor protein involved in Fe transport
MMEAPSGVSMLKQFRSLLPLLIAVSSAHAQTTATLSGSTLDKSGAAVPGVKVVAVNQETQISREAVSSDSGVFAIQLLPPGTYSIRVEKQGFRAIRQENVRLEVNQSVQLDFSLDVGAVTETIEVKDTPPLLDSATSAIGQVIENRQITELPLNGRNFVQLATLSPGVSGVGYNATGTIMSGTRPDDSRPGSELFANGNREGSNNFLLDGIDNNDRLTLSITLRPSVEGVQEFKIQTSLFSAEQGRSPGATINVISKSGTNQMHGSAYNFLRNSGLDARDYFAPVGQAKPPFRQNQFGASFGGPVIKNRLFYFTNYEGYRRRRTDAQLVSVPTAAMKRGDFSGVRDIFDPFSTRAATGVASGRVRDIFPNRQIPASRFDSVMGRVIQAYPDPVRAGLANNYTATLPRQIDWNQGDGRMDYAVTPNDLVFLRYSRQDSLDTRPSTFPNARVPGLDAPVGLGNEDTFAGNSVLSAHHAVVAWSRPWTPTFVMDARMGFQRFNLNFTQEGAVDGARLGEKLGVRNANQAARADGIPIFSPANYIGIGQTRSLPIIRIQNTFHPTVNFTNILGAHTIKYGAEVRRRQISEFQTNRGNGRFNFSPAFTTDPNNTGPTGDSIASLLLGTASVIEQDFTLNWVGNRGTEHGYFIQDDWRVNSRLTLNLGLRYELFTPYYEVANRIANFDVTDGRIKIAGYQGTSRTANVKTDYGNWAPRAGFAYKVSNSTVVRGGAGIFYGVQGNGGGALRLFRQMPFGPINAVDIDPLGSSPRRVQAGLDPIPNLDFAVVTSPNQPGTIAAAINPDFKSGRVMQFNLQVQHEVAPIGTVFKVGYVANLSRRLDNSYNYNLPDPGPGTPASRRPLRNINPRVLDVTYVTTDGRGYYHAFQASAEKRFSGGMSFVSGYTWSHSLDNVANQFGGAANGPLPQDIRFRNSDYGSSGFDLRHRFTHAMNYELPFGKGKKFDFKNAFANQALGGWQTNVLLTIQTGLPFTPTLATSVSNAGGSRPDRAKSGELDEPVRARWFDTSFNTADAAWRTPAQFTYGNAGRNILYGPGRVNWDFSVFKSFALTERFKLDYRCEFFNMFNTPQFGLPNSTIGTPAAGIITSLSGANRQIQMALRLGF